MSAASGKINLLRLLAWAGSRRLTPVILGMFTLLYVWFAFRSAEALVELMAAVRQSFFLQALLALVPVNFLCRGALLLSEEVRRGRLVRRGSGEAAGLYDEEVVLSPGADVAVASAALIPAGYRVTERNGVLFARKGFSLLPAKLLLLAGATCLFAGVIISIASRESVRQAVVEGEPFPGGGFVERIILAENNGLFLARNLTINVTTPDGAARSFGLYPPGSAAGRFVYPRYLGVAPHIRFTAPDLPQGIDTYSIQMIYPAGKQDELPLPATPYRLRFALEDLPGDPYATGKFVFFVTVVRNGKDVFSGRVPVGGAAEGAGTRIAIPDVKRMAATDFILDRGVFVVWTALLLMTLGVLLYLPARIFLPRREIVISRGPDGNIARSRAEGGSRRHGGMFHAALDRMILDREGSVGTT